MAKKTRGHIDDLKNRFKRFIRLDELLRSPGGVTLEEMYNDKEIDNIGKRTLQDNLKMFELNGAEYELNLSRGKKRLWRYKDISFSIFGKLPGDLKLIRETLEKLNNSKGEPHNDMVRFYLMGLQKGLDLNFMAFDTNREVKGLEHMETILDAITNHYPLKLEYQPFDKEPYSLNIHPYHLRQFNRRWFLFAYSETDEKIQNFALDRIQNVKLLNKDFIPADWDIDEYFDDIVGVSNNVNDKVETVVLKVQRKCFNYINTKPLHGTQAKLHDLETEEHIFLKLRVKVNVELKMLLFSYGDKIEVLQPKFLRNYFINAVKNMSSNYQTDSPKAKDNEQKV